MSFWGDALYIMACNVHSLSWGGFAVGTFIVDNEYLWLLGHFELRDTHVVYSLIWWR